MTTVALAGTAVALVLLRSHVRDHLALVWATILARVSVAHVHLLDRFGRAPKVQVAVWCPDHGVVEHADLGAHLAEFHPGVGLWCYRCGVELPATVDVVAHERLAHSPAPVDVVDRSAQ